MVVSREVLVEMVQHGMVCCYGLLWYGWHGMVSYGIGIVLYCMVWYGMVWYGMVWYGMVWYGMVWYSTVACWHSTVDTLLCTVSYIDSTDSSRFWLILFFSILVNSSKQITSPVPVAVMCIFFASTLGYTLTMAAIHPSARALVLTRAYLSAMRPCGWPVNRKWLHSRRAQWTSGMSCTDVMSPMSPLRSLRPLPCCGCWCCLREKTQERWAGKIVTGK